MAPTPKKKNPVNPVNDLNEQQPCTSAEILNCSEMKKSTKATIPKESTVCTRSSTKTSRVCEVKKSTTEVVADEQIDEKIKCRVMKKSIDETTSKEQTDCASGKILQVDKVMKLIKEPASKQDNVNIPAKISKVDKIMKSTNETASKKENVSVSTKITKVNEANESKSEIAPKQQKINTPVKIPKVDEFKKSINEITPKVNNVSNPNKITRVEEIKKSINETASKQQNLGNQDKSSKVDEIEKLTKKTAQKVENIGIGAPAKIITVDEVKKSSIEITPIQKNMSAPAKIVKDNRGQKVAAQLVSNVSNVGTLIENLNGSEAKKPTLNIGTPAKPLKSGDVKKSVPEITLNIDTSVKIVKDDEIKKVTTETAPNTSNVSTPTKISNNNGVSKPINETTPNASNVGPSNNGQIEKLTNETTKNAQNVGTSAKILNGDGVKRSIKETTKDILSVYSKKFKINTIEPNNELSSSSKKSKSEPEYVIAEEHEEAIKLASELPKETRLELFNKMHLNYASPLIEIFNSVPQNELKKVVEYAKTRVNSELLQYAYSVALLHRNDLSIQVQIPSHASIQPNMYFDMTKFKDYLQDMNAIRIKGGKKDKILVPISEDFTATDLDPEHRCAYFREDIGLNLHHRHWHEVYPNSAPIEIVRKDRRGELFYYMHQQIMARYNFERLSNRLHRVEPYEDFKQLIPEAYFPKLDSISGDSDFGSRPANITLKDVRREQLNSKLFTMELWRQRIYEAIDRGQAYTIDRATNREVLRRIDPVTGIDELGNTIEAVRSLSWNDRFYGDLHNQGHVVFGYAHDPDNRFKEQSGVMAAPETAMRDPIFYRWHEHIDNIFQDYKRTLPPYTPEQKQFQNINIQSVKILPQSEKLENVISQDGVPLQVSNVLKTFWEKDVVDVTQGVIRANQPQPKEEIFAVFTHLQHEEFEFEIEVRNDLPQAVTGTVRIFLAPHNNEAGKKMSFNEQRRLFIELDKFTARMEPGRTTTIKRKSTESSVTIPFSKTFMSYKDAKRIVIGPQSNQSQLNQPQPNQSQLNQPQLNQPQTNQTQSNQPQPNQPQLNQSQLNQQQPNQPQLNQLKLNQLQQNQPQPNQPQSNKLQSNQLQPIQPQSNQPKLNQTQLNEPQTSQPQLNQPQLSQQQSNQLQAIQPQLNQLQSNSPQPNQSQPNQLQSTQPQSNQPQLNQPQMNRQQSNQLQTNRPQLNQPQSNQPQTNQPQTNRLQSNQPQTNRPQSNPPQTTTNRPQSSQLQPNQVQQNQPQPNQSQLNQTQLIQQQNSYCSCGWPQHLLIGKGTPGKGLLCDLFVMITNYEDDRVVESPLVQSQSCCEKSSLSYCGVRNRRYPDRKPMGFPFDRDISNVTQFIEDFMADRRPQNANNRIPARFSNMTLVPVLVRHLEGLPRCGKSLKNLGCTDELFEKIVHHD